MSEYASLYDIVNRAILTFNEQEKYLLENDLSERCICARFAMHLSNALQGTEYSEYIVDVEYNRSADGCERRLKRLDDRLITVDLIVHKRGYDCCCGFDNLICIEMKKSTNRRGCDSDEARLSKLVNSDYGFCYQAGFMILADMKACALKMKCSFQ